MAVKRKNIKEGKLIGRFRRELSRGRNICYFAVNLVSENYDPVELAELAKRGGFAQKLGYLAEVCAEATRLMHLCDESNKLTKLYKGLESSFDDWQYLDPRSCEEARSLARKRASWGVMSQVMNKWKLYSLLEPEEVEDFLDLYVTFDYTNYDALERHDMMMKGRHYTREVVRNGREGTRVY